VRYHNIVGEVSDESFFRRFSGEGDGVVELASARVPHALSEISVPADHSNVHNHPLAVLEVQRVLREHLRELRTAAAQPRYTPAEYGPPPMHTHWQSYGIMAR
jgi:hypothetical protein